MRKHGWQLPYHPLQVVAIAVFLALGFALYVLFAPFVGKKMLQYIVIGIYTPLIVSALSLYIWCAAADPTDPRVFKSKKYLKIRKSGKHTSPKDSTLGGERKISSERPSCFLLACFSYAFICNCCDSSKESSIQQMSKEGIFCCSLCEVEVFKYSKHRSRFKENTLKALMCTQDWLCANIHKQDILSLDSSASTINIAEDDVEDTLAFDNN